MKKNYFKMFPFIVLLFCASNVFAQTLSNIAPDIGMEGTTINVAISGQNSNFLQGTTTVWFNQGSSTIYASSVNVSNPTSLIAQVGIPYGTPLGLYQTNIQDPVDNTISSPNSFTVIANPNSPFITNVNPSTTMEGTALTVNISGQNSNFQQGTTTVWFNQGSSTIYASNVNVNSLTNLDAFFNIPFGTALGLYDTNVQDPVDNTITSPNSFTITANPNVPALVSVTPNNGDLGTTIPVTISGQNTNFLQGTGTLVFVQGSSTLITSNLLFNTNTDLGATLTIPPNAYPGYYDVYFTNALDGTMLLVSGFYVNPPPCGSIIVDVYQQPCPGNPATINIVGGYAPYTAVIDGQTVPIVNSYLDFYPMGIGNYTITSLVDNFGCTATALDSIIQNEEYTATLGAINPYVCQGVAAGFTNSIVSAVAVTSVFYYYGDGSSGASNVHMYNAPGTYLASMVVFNANGCNLIVDAIAPIIVSAGPQDSIVALTNATCGLTNGAFEITGIDYGPFNYAINGVGGYTSNTALNTGLAAGLYNINITDTNGCTSNSMLSIANVSVLTNITGNIQTDAGNNANNTVVNLLSLTDTVGTIAVSYTTLTDANGNYAFANLVEGNYILFAEPDTALFPDAILTYSNGSYAWYDADTINVTCTSQNVFDIVLINGIVQTGNIQIGGFVADYSFNMQPNTSVILFDDNSGQTIARTSSDASGNYSFNGINAGHYSVFVDIPGLSHVSNYTFNANPNDILWDKSFFVDFGNRTIDTVFFFVGLKEVGEIDAKVFPNPFNETTTIGYNLPTPQNVHIEVYNYLGEKVATLENENKPAGLYNTVFNAAENAKGVYFIRFTAGNKQKSFKVIHVE